MIKVDTILELYPGNEQVMDFWWESWEEVKVEVISF